MKDSLISYFFFDETDSKTSLIVIYSICMSNAIVSAIIHYLRWSLILFFFHKEREVSSFFSFMKT